MDKEEVLKKEEENILKAIIAARDVQDFLWGEMNDKWDFEEWKRMFRKRIAKIDEIDDNNPHKIIELKKRLLQTAAVAINLLTRIETDRLPKKESESPSNLDKYSKPN